MDLYVVIANINVGLVILKGILIIWILNSSAPSSLSEMSFIGRLCSNEAIRIAGDSSEAKSLRLYRFRWSSLIILVMASAALNLFQVMYSIK